MPATNQPSAKVTAVHQSPMNPKQWLLQLECGHELWVTSTRRPKAKTAKCPRDHKPPQWNSMEQI
jgi:hypothetical protein